MPFDLERFVTAQAPVYDTVREELVAGRKDSHWMWFVFPQLRALGRSEQYTPGTRLDSWIFRIIKNAWIEQRMSGLAAPVPGGPAVLPLKTRLHSDLVLVTGGVGYRF